MKQADVEAPLLQPADPAVHSSQQQARNLIVTSILSPKSFYIVLGPLLCAAVCLFVKFDDGTGGTSRNMMGVLAWIFTWWLTEAVPVPITSLAPLYLFPLFGISGADEVAHSYMDDVITLVLGSFILALAVEHYNIHRRLALNVALLFSGEPLNPRLLLLGICGTTAFVSMWMHNVAAAVMMVPVATGILQRLPSSCDERPAAVSNFCKAVVLGVIYSAAIGGLCTLTGTGVNLILVGMWKSYFPDAPPISFSTWLLFALPLGALLFVTLWGVLCLLYCRNESGGALAQYLDRANLMRELALLGPISFAEKTILGIFLMQIILWMTRNITDEIPGWGALLHGQGGDGTVSVLMATLLFIIPNKKQPGEKIMDWNKCKKLPWNIILLLGAGFAIADGVRTSGLAAVLSTALNFLEAAPHWAIAPAIALVASTITEFASNNATATLLIPLLVQIAGPMHVHPIILLVPAVIGAQFAFLLPTGTPSNVVGFATGHLEIGDMLVSGSLLKVAGIVFLSLLMPSLGEFVFAGY